MVHLEMPIIGSVLQNALATTLLIHPRECASGLALESLRYLANCQITHVWVSAHSDSMQTTRQENARQAVLLVHMLITSQWNANQSVQQSHSCTAKTLLTNVSSSAGLIGTCSLTMQLVPAYTTVRLEPSLIRRPECAYRLVHKAILLKTGQALVKKVASPVPSLIRFRGFV